MMGLEMVNPNISKWPAIKSLLAEFQIKPNEVVTIGDGHNDIEMPPHVGIDVAMGNASEKVKAAAEFIERYLIKSYKPYAI